jgi:predicted dinucleotide-binding enzyme
LADGFAKHGHHVVMGTRDPSKLKDWGGQHRIDRVGSFADAANFGELVVLAVKGIAAPDALRAAGYGERGGKACYRCNEPDRRLASRQRRAEILHQS